MTTKVNTVYRTDDLSIFKKLDGNRAVTDGRVEKIKKSIERVGYIQSPIIVNELYQIIDGQGRVEALRQLGLPVDFIICGGAGLDECIALNINLSNWKITDYIECYAGTGNTSYQYLKALMAEYSERFELPIILNAASGLTLSSLDAVKKGRFFCDAEAYERARKVLDYEADYLETLAKIDGRARYYLMSINFITNNLDINNKRLLNQVKKLYPTMAPGINMKIAMEELEKVYNHGLREKVYFYNPYQLYLKTRPNVNRKAVAK